MNLKELKKYKPINQRFSKTRHQAILRYIRNKNVLDIGSIQHNFSLSKSKGWLFKFLNDYSDSVLGIDILEEEVKKARSKGYNIIHRDVQTIKLDNKFDVIVAANIIEHLSNPGMFLKNMKKHLNKNGKMIISTNNNSGFDCFYDSLILGCLPNNPEHTCWYDYVTLKELTKREGLIIEEVIYTMNKDIPNEYSSYKSLIYRKIKYFFMNCLIMFRQHFSPIIILVLKNDSIEENNNSIKLLKKQENIKCAE